MPISDEQIQAAVLILSELRADITEIKADVKDVRIEVRATNGRVNHHDTQIAALIADKDARREVKHQVSGWFVAGGTGVGLTLLAYYLSTL